MTVGEINSQLIDILGIQKNTPQKPDNILTLLHGKGTIKAVCKYVWIMYGGEAEKAYTKEYVLFSMSVDDAGNKDELLYCRAAY